MTTYTCFIKLIDHMLYVYGLDNLIPYVVLSQGENKKYIMGDHNRMDVFASKGPKLCT